MAFNEILAFRVRKALSHRNDVTERKMFGGLAFMMRGNMCCGIVGNDLMVRVMPERYEAALRKPHARPMDFTGKPMKGMIYVGFEGCATDETLGSWVGEGVQLAESLPDKGEKPLPATKKTKKPAVANAKTSALLQSEPRPDTKKAKKAAATEAKASTSEQVKQPDETKAKKTHAKTSASRAGIQAAAAEASGFTGFAPSTLKFLDGLAKNNTKPWFDAHREDYERFYIEPAKAFVNAIGPRLREISKTVNFEPQVNGSIFRIQRDIRFSNDKTPYKPHLDLWFWEGNHKGWDAPGFFFRLLADKLIVGAGIHKFEKMQLDAYRRAVVEPKSGLELTAALGEVRKAGPYDIGGAMRKAVPRGFDPSHERARLLLHEGLYAMYEGPILTTIHSAQFVDACFSHFKAVWPVNRWLLSHLVG